MYAVLIQLLRFSDVFQLFARFGTSFGQCSVLLSLMLLRKIKTSNFLQAYNAHCTKFLILRGVTSSRVAVQVLFSLCRELWNEKLCCSHSLLFSFFVVSKNETTKIAIVTRAFVPSHRLLDNRFLALCAFDRKTSKKRIACSQHCFVLIQNQF